jgi:hypothetical protein
MRSVGFVGLAFVLFASRAAAQQPPYRAVVIDPEVKVRAAPSDQLGDTGTLPHGTVVIVEREEENGWLAITAPYGSVSWVAAQFINDPAHDQQAPKNVSVEADDGVTLAVGRAGLGQPLDVRRAKIPNGTALLVIGPAVKVENKTWYPVAPPAGDVRYVTKSSVQFERAAANNYTVRASASETAPPIPPAATPAGAAAPVVPPPGTTPIATVPGPGSSPIAATLPAASKPVVNHPLWVQAETAESENRLADAEKAYFDLAALMNGPGGDHDIANLCYTRIHAIRERKRANNTGGQPPADRGVRPGPPQALPTANGSNGSASTKSDPVAANAGGNSKPGGAAAGDPPDWIGPGVLRLSALTLDGIERKTYALESSPGVVKLYVLAGPDLDLSKYVNKKVSVFGAPQSREGLRKQVVVATKVDLQ